MGVHSTKFDNPDAKILIVVLLRDRCKKKHPKNGEQYSETHKSTRKLFNNFSKTRNNEGDYAE